MALDFDYLIVSNQWFDHDSIAQTFSLFVPLGIRKFVFTLRLDRSLLTVSQMLDRVRTLSLTIHSLRPHGITVQICPELVFMDGVCYDPQIQRLLKKNSRYLFVELPTFLDQEWMLADINHLLYKRKTLPVYTSFEANIRTNPRKIVNHLIQSEPFHACLDLNYITSLDAQTILVDMISRKARFFPCISNHWSAYAGIDSGFSDFRMRIGDTHYVQFCRNLQLLGSTVISRR